MHPDRKRLLDRASVLVLVGAACAAPVAMRNDVLRQRTASSDHREWLAGDHHVHSQFSADYADTDSASLTAPAPVLGADGRYAIPLNALKAREHGLAWMVSTDHGGPNHSKLNYEQAYPELKRSRTEVPEVIQFYGMEFDTPGADHSSMIMPHSQQEASALQEIESRFSKRDAFPRDPKRDSEQKMLEALRHMRGLDAPPVVIANHPSRSARDYGVYGQDTPSELRAWNDTAPRVAIGMEGAPGHQASAINKDGSLDTAGARGGYRNAPTMGGFDQMTATLGGFWDSMLGEGRRWWITSTSDSHRNWREGGSDFWPGEYSKTYVRARRTHDDLLDGIRNGRVFVTTGDLISELDVVAAVDGDPDARAEIGGTLALRGSRAVRVTIRMRDPRAPNHHGDTPSVARVDLIVGRVTGRATDRALDRNPTTAVVRRFTASDWTRDGEYLVMTHLLRGVDRGSYLRVRGTSTSELEPTPDKLGEDPWKDLWFYSNPIFVAVPRDSVAVIEESFITPFDTLDNIDSPAVYHAGTSNWLLATAKTGNAVVVYDASSGKTLRRLTSGKPAAGLSRPNGIAVAESLLFVVERDDARVHVYRLPSLASAGTFGEGVLRKPYGIAVRGEKQGGWTVWVTDNYETPEGGIPRDRELGARVKQFHVDDVSSVLNARLTRSFGDTTSAGALRTVESIVVDRELDRLLIAEETEVDSHVKVYDMNGRFTGQVFGRGLFPQQAEGLALYRCENGSGYVIATDQGDSVNTFHVFDRASFQHRGSFTGRKARRTDGVALTQRSFGPFPSGAFYASHLDGGVAAFSWQRIAKALVLRSDCQGSAG